MFSGKRAFSIVLSAAVLVAIAIGALASLEITAPLEDGRVVLGQREVVRLDTPSAGEAVLQTALVAPSIDRTSISLDVALDLGLDLTASERATVRSAFGEEVRPLTPVAITIGQVTREVEVSVSTRAGLDDAVVLGRDVIGDALVDPTRSLVTEPAQDAPPVFTLRSTLLGREDVLGANALLALLPVGALVIVVLRYLVGITTLGTFAPILVAVAFLQAGVVPALTVMAVIIGLGLALEPLLHRLRVPRVARLGVLIGIASLVLVGLTEWFGTGGAVAQWGAAFPLVVAAGLVEQLWDVVEADGLRDAVVTASGTLGVALAAIPVLLAEPVRRLSQSMPWLVVLVAVGLIAAAGSYRGLRLSELVRFRGAARRHGAPV